MTRVSRPRFHMATRIRHAFKADRRCNNRKCDTSQTTESAVKENLGDVMSSPLQAADGERSMFINKHGRHSIGDYRPNRCCTRANTLCGRGARKEHLSSIGPTSAHRLPRTLYRSAPYREAAIVVLIKPHRCCLERFSPISKQQRSSGGTLAERCPRGIARRAHPAE